jgi:hypothetical protein
MKIIVLAARNWELRDDKTGEIRSGVSIEGTEAMVSNEKDYKGSGFVNYSASDEAWNDLKAIQLPAICDVEVGVKKGKDRAGKSIGIMTILSIKLVSTIDLLKKAA